MDSYAKIKELEERFLSKDEKTVEDVPQTYSEEEEIDHFMMVAQNSAMSCFLAIEMLLKHGSEEQLDSHFGSGSAELLKETKECLEEIAGMFLGSEEPEEEPEELEEPESQEPEEEEPTEEA